MSNKNTEVKKTKVFWTPSEKAEIQLAFDFLGKYTNDIERVNRAIIEAMPESRRRVLTTLTTVPWLYTTATAFPVPVGIAQRHTNGLQNFWEAMTPHFVEFTGKLHEEIMRMLPVQQVPMPEEHIRMLVDEQLKARMSGMFNMQPQPVAKVAKVPTEDRLEIRDNPSKLTRTKQGFIPVFGLGTKASNVINDTYEHDEVRAYTSHYGLNIALASSKVSDKLLMSEQVLENDTPVNNGIQAAVKKYFKGDVVYFRGGFSKVKSLLSMMQH